MSDYYILEGHKTVKSDMLSWVKMFEKVDRVVNKTKLGKVEVDTVFIGLQFGNDPPILFQTMVFGVSIDQNHDRCTTWAEAEAMHEAMCQRVRDTQTESP